jgi:hypothetical protein
MVYKRPVINFLSILEFGGNNVKIYLLIDSNLNIYVFLK